MLGKVTAELQVSENERIQLLQSVNKQRDKIDKLQEQLEKAQLKSPIQVVQFHIA